MKRHKTLMIFKYTTQTFICNLKRKGIILRQNSLTKGRVLITQTSATNGNLQMV